MANGNVDDEALYEQAAIDWQCLEIGQLNQILKNKGVDGETRRAICKTYFFGSGNFLDQGSLRVEGVVVAPRLFFARMDETGLPPDGPLVPPSQFFAFHEYAFGNIDWYFNDHNESVESIEVVSPRAPGG